MRLDKKGKEVVLKSGCENTLEIRRYYVLYVLIYITYNTQGYYAKDTLVVYSYYTLYRYLSVYACMHPALSGMAHVLALCWLGLAVTR